MGMKKKLVSFAAVLVVAGAIGAAPASASTPTGFTIPDAASLCKSVPQPSLQAACNKGVASLGACASAKSVNAAISCVSRAVGGIRLPSLGGIKLPSLGGLSGLKLPGGLDLSKLLGGLKR